MGDLAPFVQAGGAVGVVVVALVAVIGYLLNSNRKDREQALGQVAAAEKRADDAEARADLAEQKTSKAEERLDDERAKRRGVEDQLGQVLVEIRQLKHKVSHLEVELAKYAAANTSDGGGAA